MSHTREFPVKEIKGSLQTRVEPFADLGLKMEGFGHTKTLVDVRNKVLPDVDGTRGMYRCRSAQRPNIPLYR